MSSPIGDRRAKIGLLVPSANTWIEPDCHRIAPADVTIHAARIGVGLEGMADASVAASRQLAAAEVTVIAFGCTVGSFMEGADYDLAVAARIEAACGIPVITTSTAALQALRSLGVRNVAVATPYEAGRNQLLRRFLTENGLAVMSLHSLGITEIGDIAKVPAATVYELGREADRGEADGIFLSCTNFRATEIAECLEADLGKPVVTSNQATAWAALRRCGVHDQIRGFGRLLEL